MRLYYSHSMMIYGTQKERSEQSFIQHHFPGAEIIDPGAIQANPEKARRGMEYCLDLVETCDALVFTRFEGAITSGVGMEVNHALSKGKRVHELRKQELFEITGPVEYLSREETVKLYQWSHPLRLPLSESATG